MNNRSFIKQNPFLSKLYRLPYLLLSLIILVCVCNLVILYSSGDCNLHPWCYKQSIFFTIFLPIMIIITLIDLRTIFSFSYFFYVLVVILLIAVALFGYKAMGAKRWIHLGFFRMQPAELAKIAIVMMLAKYFNSLNSFEIKQLRMLVTPTFGVLIPAFLIIKQPDLGTGLVVLFVSSIIFFVAGVQKWKFLLAFSSVTAASPIIWNFLYDYQKKRILTFLYPENDRLGDGYNIMQSKIAIGSGGFWGKGICMGTQSKLTFLPEHQTDFIFSALVEEFGFLGGLGLCILYMSIIYLSIMVAINAKSIYSKLLVIGLISIFFFHIFINIGMVMGLLPAVGIPLPLMSYGGTMVGSILIGFGLIMNVHVNNNMKL